MNLSTIIDQEIKTAMLAKDRIKLDTLRSIKTVFMESMTAKGASHELSDEQIIAILQRMVKQRKDSAEVYKEQNREELAEKELAEIEVLQLYLPVQLSKEELDSKINDIIKELGASSMKDMGRVIGMANKQLAGKAEGRAIADTVKRLLSSQ